MVQIYKQIAKNQEKAQNVCMELTQRVAVLAVWVWGNAEKVLRETPPSCSNLPTKSFPFSEKVFMPALRHAELASLIFRPGYGQYGVESVKSQTNKKRTLQY